MMIDMVQPQVIPGFDTGFFLLRYGNAFALVHSSVPFSGKKAVENNFPETFHHKRRKETVNAQRPC
ncbi:MAG: hypothetical protein HY842_19280 [Bacteroidetes bacterium]|nr:hypothetical protein [Bacteroidota bacterium]